MDVTSDFSTFSPLASSLVLLFAAGISGALLAGLIATAFWRHSKLSQQREFDVLNSRCASSQVELTELQISNAAIRERLNARDTKLVDLEKANRQLETQLSDTQQMLAASRENVSRLQTRLDEQSQQTEEKLQLLKEAKNSMSDGFKNLANEIFESKQKEFKSQSREQLSGVLDPLHERIKAFEKRVEDSYNQESKERHSLVNEIRGLQDLNSRIAEDAVNLTNALKGESKTQGVWGEIVLERVLESSGMEKGREYQLQVSLKQTEGKRYQPDAIVKLPDGKDVIVDAKASLTAYERYCSTADETEQADSLAAHIQSMRQHIKGLAAKDYQNLNHVRTLDYVLMFVPIESAFSLAIQHDGNLYNYALENQIVIVTPTTLLATLRTIQNMWRVEQQNKNAEEIAERAGRLYDKFVNFVADLELIGSRLSSTQSAYDDAFNKLASGRGNLIKKAEDMKTLGIKASKSLPANLVEMPSRELPIRDLQSRDLPRSLAAVDDHPVESPPVESIEKESI